MADTSRLPSLRLSMDFSLFGIAASRFCSPAPAVWAKALPTFMSEAAASPRPAPRTVRRLVTPRKGVESPCSGECVILGLLFERALNGLLALAIRPLLQL